MIWQEREEGNTWSRININNTNNNANKTTPLHASESFYVHKGHSLSLKKIRSNNMLRFNWAKPHRSWNGKQPNSFPISNISQDTTQLHTEVTVRDRSSHGQPRGSVPARQVMQPWQKNGCGFRCPAHQVLWPHLDGNISFSQLCHS